jgi:hypothetical protein
VEHHHSATISGEVASIFCLIKLDIDSVDNVVLQGNKALQ